MCSAASQQPIVPSWLSEHGPRELESLFRAIVFHPSAPILVVDSERNSRDASYGAAKLLGVPREQIIGRPFDEFAEPADKPLLPQLWKDFLKEGQQVGTLQLVGAGGTARQVAYIAKGNILPVRHVVVLRDKTAVDRVPPTAAAAEHVPGWLQDYALFLLNASGIIVAWYGGAGRIYGFSSEEAVGRHVSLLYPAADTAVARLEEELARATREGHFGTEDWCIRRDGERFWANVITMALKDESGQLQGFARIARDFSERHARDEELRRDQARQRLLPPENAVAGLISGEFDRIPEANDAFLQMVGYTREDVTAGRLHWPDLSPPEYFALDELAHEEALRFGACTPFEKELIRKDGSRVHVRVATAVLQLSPFRWVSLVSDLSDREESRADDGRDPSHFEEIVGRSGALKRVLGQVEVVAPTDATVLILGETGTGKELVARAVHRLSPRRDRPFITLNCAAIPTGLLESELFGYERGAFTGALSQKIGRFELAHKGTLFLDEVGDIPLDLQPKLLRALQEKSFERLGGIKTIPIDVRLVAATNRNLTQMMNDKLFRSDLYYRLKVFPITTPPLRDRPDDIPVLVRHFTEKYSRAMNKQIDKISSETMQAFVNWPWPGNVRELENFIERAVILSRGPSLRAPLAEIRGDKKTQASGGTLAQVEREYVLRVLRETGGVISKAATRLGMPRTTLNALMHKLDISRKDF